VQACVLLLVVVEARVWYGCCWCSQGHAIAAVVAAVLHHEAISASQAGDGAVHHKTTSS
jgi:hypothetical protein